MLTEEQLKQIEKELVFFTSRSGGKGGQHVNKVESKVQLVWDVLNSRAFNEDDKLKLSKLPVNEDNKLLIVAQTHRSQLKNKEEALSKLILLIKKCLRPIKKRKKSKISKAAKEKKLKTKKIQALKKQNRQKPTI